MIDIYPEDSKEFIPTLSDSQTEGISENEPIVPVVPEGTDSSEKESEPSDFDLSALQKRLEDVQAQAATRADLENLKRQAGHVPALQREIADLKAELSKHDANRERLDVLEDLLIDALPVDRAERYEQERAQRGQASALDEKLQPILDRLDQVAGRQTAPEPEEVDPRYAAYAAAVELANNAVTKYAEEKGIDPTSIPAEVYQRAQAASSGDLAAATREVLKYVDEQVATTAAVDRRTERKEAASGGTPKERQGSMGQYDFSTIAGLAQAKKDGAIDSAKFMEEYRRLRGGVI